MIWWLPAHDGLGTPFCGAELGDEEVRQCAHLCGTGASGRRDEVQAPFREPPLGQYGFELFVGKILRRYELGKLGDCESCEDCRQEGLNASSAQRAGWADNALLSALVGKAPNVALAPIYVCKTLMRT